MNDPLHPDAYADELWRLLYDDNDGSDDDIVSILSEFSDDVVQQAYLNDDLLLDFDPDSVDAEGIPEPQPSSKKKRTYLKQKRPEPLPKPPKKTHFADEFQTPWLSEHQNDPEWISLRIGQRHKRRMNEDPEYAKHFIQRRRDYANDWYRNKNELDELQLRAKKQQQYKFERGILDRLAETEHERGRIAAAAAAWAAKMDATTTTTTKKAMPTDICIQIAKTITPEEPPPRESGVLVSPVETSSSSSSSSSSLLPGSSKLPSEENNGCAIQ
jgi:hypothetical protein